MSTDYQPTVPVLLRTLYMDMVSATGVTRSPSPTINNTGCVMAAYSGTPHSRIPASNRCVAMSGRKDQKGQSMVQQGEKDGRKRAGGAGGGDECERWGG